MGLRGLHGLLPPLFPPLRSFREILISDMMREFRGGNGGIEEGLGRKGRTDWLAITWAPEMPLLIPLVAQDLPLLSTGGVLEISCNRSPSLALVGHLARKNFLRHYFCTLGREVECKRKQSRGEVKGDVFRENYGSPSSSFASPDPRGKDTRGRMKGERGGVHGPLYPLSLVRQKRRLYLSGQKRRVNGLTKKFFLMDLSSHE